MTGKGEVITGVKNGSRVSALKCSNGCCRLDSGGRLQVAREESEKCHAGLKVDMCVEEVANEGVVWAMCRWRLSVQWKRYMVRRAIEWIRHGEGFIFWDGEGEFEPEVWGIRAEDRVGCSDEPEPEFSSSSPAEL